MHTVNKHQCMFILLFHFSHSLLEYDVNFNELRQNLLSLGITFYAYGYTQRLCLFNNQITRYLLLRSSICKERGHPAKVLILAFISGSNVSLSKFFY